MSDTKFIIIYDTYCGWCYGASPMFDALVAAEADVELLHRHLFQDPLAYRMSKGKGAYVLKADAQIAALTGQTFSQKYRDNIVLSDTEVLASNYTAQAAALVHDLGPDKEFAVRARLETARYIEGISAADRDAVVDALIAEGIPRSEAERIGTPELAALADETAQRAERYMAAVGSRGVPTVLRQKGDKLDIIDHSAFYADPNAIETLIQSQAATA